MTEETRHNIRAIRDLLETAFSVEELRGLFSFAENRDLRPVADQFTPEDSKPAMVRKAVEYCRSRFLLDELLAEVKDANPRAYERFEPELIIAGTEQSGEEEPAAGPTPEILTITSPISLRLVRIPAGEFLMGSVAARDEHAQDDEFPPHSVYVPEFYIGQYPVTNLQYQAFVKATERQAPYGWESGGIPNGKVNHPVADVGWQSALAFCAWLSEETGRPFRLPTEAEWEKAARGTDGRIYPWGDEPPNETLCNYDKKVGDTTLIGRYSPHGDSPYGCADMAGNVSEWCQSLWRFYPYSAGDGREEMEEFGPRILRGGSWYHGLQLLRCAYRASSHTSSWITIPRASRAGSYPDHWIIIPGFRVAMGPLR